MAVSGAPLQSAYHALHISDLALAMVECVTTLANPALPGEHVNIRIGRPRH